MPKTTGPAIRPRSRSRFRSRSRKRSGRTDGQTDSRPRYSSPATKNCTTAGFVSSRRIMRRERERQAGNLMLMRLPLASSESNVKSDVRWDHTGRARSRRVIRGQQMQCPINSGARPPNALVPSFRSFVCFLNNHDSLPVTVREGVQALSLSLPLSFSLSLSRAYNRHVCACMINVYVRGRHVYGGSNRESGCLALDPDRFRAFVE